MAEILVRFTDKVPQTNLNYAMNLCALDFVVVCDDGWLWTDTELNNPDWRIVKVPGVSAAFLAQYAAPRLDPVKGTIVRKRDWCLDVTQVPAAVMTYIQNNQVITLTTAQAQKVATWVRKHSTDPTQS